MIHAALFVEAPRHHVRRLVRLVLHTLLAAIATHARCGGDGRDARGQLASFVWHMLASGLEPTVKTCLLGRTLGLLTDTERAAIIDKHVDLVPAHFYQPPSRVGEAVVDDGGHRWRTIHLAFDDIAFVGGEKRVTWDGLVFSGFMGQTSHGSGVHVFIDLATHAEAPRVAPRAVIIEVAHAYDPLDPISVGPFCPVPRGTATLGGQQEARHAASGRSLRHGATLVLDGMTGAPQPCTKRLLSCAARPRPLLAISKPMRLSSWSRNWTSNRSPLDTCSTPPPHPAVDLGVLFCLPLFSLMVFVCIFL